MKSNNTSYCIVGLLLCVIALSDCDGEKANTDKFTLQHHTKVAVGYSVKVSGSLPSKLTAAANLSFEWKAEHGKFPLNPTTDASNVYTAPAFAVADKITVSVWQGNKLIDTAHSSIEISGSNGAATPATPATESSASASLGQGGANPAAAAANSVSLDSLYYPAGWMGDAQATDRILKPKFVQVENNWQDNPHSAPSCYKWTYRPAEQGWAAVAWQYPENNWGKQPGRNLTGFSKITVWLRGERGDETLTLKAGGHTEHGMPHQATFEVFPVTATLSREWQKFEIKLSGNLKNIPTAFVWVATRQDNPSSPIVFYLDDLRLEK